MAKGTDRRAAYTRSVIKEALLALKKSMPFDEITVSALCREAGIHRGTFYLHYRNTMEVLDEVLDDALDNVRDLPSHLSGGSDGCRCGYPLCRFLRESEKYRPVLMDARPHRRALPRAVYGLHAPEERADGRAARGGAVVSAKRLLCDQQEVRRLRRPALARRAGGRRSFHPRRSGCLRSGIDRCRRSDNFSQTVHKRSGCAKVEFSKTPFQACANGVY